MNFLIISHTDHYKVDNHLYAYAPYVREMNLWLKFFDQIHVIDSTPVDYYNNINLAYLKQGIIFFLYQIIKVKIISCMIILNQYL